ncbi:hypothetical protein GOP47_0008604 [Adiantum capillus-veneris]|uniref:Uncharacterized protein n=1 Tax=Adiantum capillus-veneris TaxID=13818 RepID=A0A9D4ZIC4_ADICA|nr:hypothetical protein GOP47_0008604 [Adiantum capillus-veneris]
MLTLQMGNKWTYITIGVGGALLNFEIPSMMERVCKEPEQADMKGKVASVKTPHALGRPFIWNKEGARPPSSMASPAMATTTTTTKAGMQHGSDYVMYSRRTTPKARVERTHTEDDRAAPAEAKEEQMASDGTKNVATMATAIKRARSHHVSTLSSSQDGTWMSMIKTQFWLVVSLRKWTKEVLKAILGPLALEVVEAKVMMDRDNGGDNGLEDYLISGNRVTRPVNALLVVVASFLVVEIGIVTNSYYGSDPRYVGCYNGRSFYGANRGYDRYSSRDGYGRDDDNYRDTRYGDHDSGQDGCGSGGPTRYG